jgi:hypothetical protein
MQLGLQLGDAALGRAQLGLLAAGQAGFQAAVDAVLAAPGLDRLVGDPQCLGDLSYRPAGLDQVQDLAAELGRIPRRPMLPLSLAARNPTTRLH